MFRFSRRQFLHATAAFAAGSVVSPAAFAANLSDDLRALYETDAGLATDAVWCRRLHLDLTGRPPTVEEAKAFVRSTARDKRQRLADRLLASEDFADYWSMRYCDLLRVKSEFPVNLWPNAVYVYHRRIRESIARDESWLTFARALLTATGSNFRDAEANFFRACAQRTPRGFSETAAYTFLGRPSAAYADCFASVRIKTTREWKEEIVYVEPGGKTPADFAARLTGDLNDTFCRAHAVRLSTWLFGVPPAADRSADLTARFRAGDYRLKPFLRQLVLSADYAKGSLTGGFPIRRLDAEVLEDALCSRLNLTRSYQSIAPEPFTLLPPDRKSVLIEDGSISSAFLILFGRPARDTGHPDERDNGVTAKQRLHLFNSGRLHAALQRLLADKAFRRLKPSAQIDRLYWRFLGRAPAARERNLILARFRDPALSPKARWWLPNNVAWCLINTKEFLFRI